MAEQVPKRMCLGVDCASLLNQVESGQDSNVDYPMMGALAMQSCRLVNGCYVENPLPELPAGTPARSTPIVIRR